MRPPALKQASTQIAYAIPTCASKQAQSGSALSASECDDPHLRVSQNLTFSVRKKVPEINQGFDD